MMSLEYHYNSITMFKILYSVLYCMFVLQWMISFRQFSLMRHWSPTQRGVNCKHHPPVANFTFETFFLKKGSIVQQYPCVANLSENWTYRKGKTHRGWWNNVFWEVRFRLRWWHISWCLTKVDIWWSPV